MKCLEILERATLMSPRSFPRRLVSVRTVVVLSVVVFAASATVGTGVEPLDQAVDEAVVAALGAVDDTMSGPAPPDDAGTETGSGGGFESDAAGATDTRTRPESGEPTDSRTDLDRAAVERYVHQFVNEERRAHGLQPVDRDRELRRIARYHSRDMAGTGYFSHTSPGGETMGDRYETFGYDCRVKTQEDTYAAGSENIAYTWYRVHVQQSDGDTVYHTDEKQLARGIVEGWMNSPGHRENILRPYWDDEGIGVAVTQERGNTKVYATQNFC